ncbi:hypothetical protein ACLIJS_07835 [Mammaliicoccus sciuri]|uniref:hypothetical protein n=1 Tax=Mammaliicoccus sciuri TaxID=1296 RepID=UPI003A8CFC79
MKKILTVITVMVFALAGCGKATDEKEVKFSDVMNDKKETISYVVTVNSDDSPSIGKNSDILQYIISKNGKITVYNSNDDNLGKLSKMSDDEKIKYIKKSDKKHFEDDKSTVLFALKDKLKQAEKDLETDIENGNSEHTVEESNTTTMREHYTRKIKILKKAIKKVESTNYKKPTSENLVIEVSTDETGNNTKKEFINVEPHGFDAGDEGKYIDSKKSANPKEYGEYFTNVVSPTEIYDKKVAGIGNIDYVEDDSSYANYNDYMYLVTEVGDKTEKFKLDQPDDKNVKEK